MLLLLRRRTGSRTNTNTNTASQEKIPPIITIVAQLFRFYKARSFYFQIIYNHFFEYISFRSVSVAYMFVFVFVCMCVFGSKYV